MKTLVCAIALFICVYTCSAQTDSTKKHDPAISKADSTGNLRNAEGAFIKVEVESEFPGASRNGSISFNRISPIPVKQFEKTFKAK